MGVEFFFRIDFNMPHNAPYDSSIFIGKCLKIYINNIDNISMDPKD